MTDLKIRIAQHPNKKHKYNENLVFHCKECGAAHVHNMTKHYQRFPAISSIHAVFWTCPCGYDNDIPLEVDSIDIKFKAHRNGST